MTEVVNGDGSAATTTSAGTGDSATTTTQAAATTATTTDSGASFDPEKDLTKEQWSAIYGSGRFKQLNERAQKASELEKAQTDAEEAALKEKGEWQKVAETKDQQLTQMQTAVVNAEIKAEASRLGAVNPAIIANAIDRTGVVFKDGDVTGVSEAIEALKASDPYLFNNSNNQTTRIGTATNPNSNANGFKFKMSQIRDPKFYQENKAAIKAAVATGQVDQNS